MGKNKRVKSFLAGLSQDVLLSLQTPQERSAKRILDQQSTRGQVKRRKLAGLLGEGWEEYDATNSVPFYTAPSEVPEKLKKCKL